MMGCNLGNPLLLYSSGNNFIGRHACCQLAVLTNWGVSALFGNLSTVSDVPTESAHACTLSLSVTDASPAGMVPAVGRGELLAGIKRGGAPGII
jgi:hypothetical protein